MRGLCRLLFKKWEHGLSLISRASGVRRALFARLTSLVHGRFPFHRQSDPLTGVSRLSHQEQLSNRVYTRKK